MTDGSDTRMKRILELASSWQIADAMTMLEESKQSEDVSSDMEACRQLINGVGTIEEGHYATGIREALPALLQLEQHGYRSYLDWAYSAIGFSIGILGNPETGLEWVGRAIAGAESRADESQLRRSLSAEAGLFAMIDEEDKSIASYEKALKLKSPPPAKRELAGLLNNAAYAYMRFARRLEQEPEQRSHLAQSAMMHARSVLDILDESGNERFIARSLENLGSALSLLGRFDEAEDVFKRALPLSEPFERINVEVLTSYAWLLSEMDQYQAADAMLVLAYDQAQAGEQETSIDRILETRIRLEVLAGRSEEALLWSERRFRMMEKQSRKRLVSVARNAGILSELESLTVSLQQQSRSLQDEALKDPLTGCFNRQGLTTLSASFFAPQSRTALALVDVDNFKQINDSPGHETGDRVIQTVAQIIKKSLRDTDLVTRFDSDEFLLLLHGIEANPAWGTCERLRLAIEHFGWGTIADRLRVTVSIGLAVRSANENLDALTSKAGVSLHRAKAEGRNKVVI